jgi:hypothetical protein
MAWPTSNFPTSLDVITDKVDNVDDIAAADINGAYDCIEKIEAKVGINGSVVNTSIDYLLKNSSSIDPGHKHTNISLSLFPAGTKMVFYQDTAPTGWTIENTLDDKLLFITKGSAAGGQKGGGAHSTGTWTQPSHTLTEAEIPSHRHALMNSTNTHDEMWGAGQAGDNAGSPQYSGYTGGGGAHYHGTTWRPAAYCAIIASKD